MESLFFVFLFAALEFPLGWTLSSAYRRASDLQYPPWVSLAGLNCVTWHVDRLSFLPFPTRIARETVTGFALFLFSTGPLIS